MQEQKRDSSCCCCDAVTAARAALECVSTSLPTPLSLSLTLFLNWIRDAPWARPNKKKGWTYRLARVDVVRGNSDYRHREAAGRQAGSGRKLLSTIDLTFFIRNILNAYWAHLREERRGTFAWIDKSCTHHFSPGKSQQRRLGFR